MEVQKKKNGENLLVAVSGRLDTTTALDFGSQITDDLDDIKELVLDFSDVEYVSSFGLRMILDLQKIMNKQGHMKILNVNESVRNIFEITGFMKILTVE